MAVKITCVLLALVVVCYGFPYHYSSYGGGDNNGGNYGPGQGRPQAPNQSGPGFVPGPGSGGHGPGQSVPPGFGPGQYGPGNFNPGQYGPNQYGANQPNNGQRGFPGQGGQGGYKENGY